ncbi:transmembrane channel-like protein 7 isoform X2 [Mya arenaria]|uniref:transmembrane channel-like protein 7 isoform X2 n=1 Tax=Mya arenaria TaxID=6604 RepID=UPI0022E2B469|nr:transmembrane channel-like protein 7 isoform X2 [Mya arenaria]
MFRRGAARVSPDPWGLPADDDNYQLEDVQPHPPPPPTLKATAATKDTVPILPPPSPPQKRQVTPVTSPAIPPPPSPERNNNNVRQNSAVIVVKPVEKPKEEFVYKKNEKHPEIVTSTNKELDQYVDRKFNQNHAWTPYLHERKREMLMKGPMKSSKGFKYSMKSKWNSFKISWREATYSLEVWKGALKKIEGHQGMGVVSYFTFLRWLLFLNIFIFLLLFFCITIFQVSFNSTTEYVSDLVGNDGQFSAYTTNVTSCSSSYSPNVSSDALTRILDFFQGTGWMENTAMFNGFYTDRKKELAASEYNMPLAYFLVTVLVLLFSLIIMVRNTLSNFKETVLAKENSKQGVYCNTVFAAFDYMVDEDEAVKLKQKSIYNGLVADLGDQRHEMEVRNRTRGQKCKVFTVRFLINFLILIMLGGAGAAIYYAQDYSSNFTTDPNVADNYHSLVILLVEFLPSIVIGLLNGMYPVIFGILVKFEDYRPVTVIKITLIRMVFLRLASLTMIVASLYVQITCKDKNSCDVGQNDCPAISCWETYVGSAVYKLVVFDFNINAAVTIFVEGTRKLITSKCECGLAKSIGPAVFDVPLNVLSLVYSQTLLWLGFHFAPLISGVSVVNFFLMFYIKYLSALYFTVPPEKPYQASKSNSFFTIILMVAFFMICIPVGYTLSNMNPSPMCGPFRIYDKPSDIIDVQIGNAATWFNTIWTITTSSAVVSAVIILLILMVYYCSALNSAHKDLSDMMKEQLVLEGKDKQFLLARINELGGAPPKKKPPPAQHKKATMQTVNEKQPMRNGDVVMEDMDYRNDAPPPADYNYNSNNVTRHEGPSQVSTRNVEVTPTSPQPESKSAMDDW